MKINCKLLVLGLPLLAACSQTPSKHNNVVLEKSSQCPIRLEMDQTLTLTLPSNPSTGYRWLLQNPAAGILRSLGPEVYSHPEDAGIVGSAGESTWRFLAQAAGEGHLLLVYQQPWAPEVKPVQSFDCRILVQ